MTFEDQVDRLVAMGYPALAALQESAFRDLLAPLGEAAHRLDEAEQAEQTDRPGRTAYVVVVTRALVDPTATVPLLRLVKGRKPGVVDRNHAPGDLATYDPLPELEVPDAPAYLLVDVDRGEEFCGSGPRRRCR